MAFTTTSFFAISGKYHEAIWIDNYVIMANHISGLKLQCHVVIFSMFMYIDVTNSPKVDSLMEINELTNIIKKLIYCNFCVKLQYVLENQ